ncbi:MAG: GspH/FimT family pseudopilin [Sphingomonas sp.]|jgi:general secretion pathway protein H
MPISQAGNKPAHSRARGFTLVELLIVVTILALASAATVLALPDPRGRLVEEAERFAARARAAHDSAIIEARSVSIWVTPQGYGFDRRAGGTWRPIADKPLRVARWAQDVNALLPPGDERGRIIFDSTGSANQPLDVQLRRERETITVSIDTSGAIGIHGR